MHTGFRAALVVIGVLMLALAIAFLVSFGPVTQLWPFSSYNKLGNVFLASIFAAIALPVLWIGWANEPASIPGGATNILVSGAGIGVYALMEAAAGRAPQALGLGIASLVIAALALVLILYGLRRTFRDTRPTPAIVRWSFLLFVLLLLGVGGALVANVPGLFPWSLDRNASVVYGFAFLGAAGYFGFGFIKPVWGNAKGQLLAFLAYDLVLIGPFAALWSTVSPALRLSLALYLLVLVYSGGLAIYFVLINPRLRIGTRPAPRVELQPES